MVAELKDLGLAASPEAPTPRQLTFDDLAKLPYLTAVIKVQAISFRQDTALSGAHAAFTASLRPCLMPFSFT